MRVIKIFGDEGQYSISMFEYLVVPEAQHTVTLPFQHPGPDRICFLLRRMLSAIQLDDQSFIRTAEINDVITDRMLATELLAS